MTDLPNKPDNDQSNHDELELDPELIKDLEVDETPADDLRGGRSVLIPGTTH